MTVSFSLHERSLFVIEQPGKKSRLAMLLRKVGFTNFEIHATRGALFDLPERAIAISPISLMVTGYEVKKRDVTIKLQSLATEATRVIVMTDADREGELIAAQVRQLCPSKPVIRAPIRAMTLDAVKEALSNPTKIDVGAATAAASRRIVDRIIGFGFSDPDPHRRGASGIVGRVLTSALSAFARFPVACAEWSGRVGEYEVRGTITNRTIDEAKRLEVFMQHAAHEIERLPKKRITRLIAPPPPCHCADAILEARRRLNVPTWQAETLLKASYEQGDLSYVRTDSTHLGPAARALAVKLAQNARLTIAKDLDHIHLPPSVVSRKHSHEALHPTYEVDLTLDPGAQDKQAGLLAIIARRLAMSIAAPVEVESERIAPAALKAFIADRLGEAAAEVDLRLTRDTNALPPWMDWLKRVDNTSSPRIEMFGADATALSFLAGSRFGRPSSQIYLVEKFLRSGYLDQLGNVTPVGQQLLSYAKERAPFLLDHERIEKFEQTLDTNHSNSVQGLVVQLCDVMGVPVELAQSAVYDWYAMRKIPAPHPSTVSPRSV